VKLVANNHGGGGCQIIIDNFYQGNIVYIDGSWQAHLNNKTILTGDDISVLGEIIEGRNH